MYNSSAPPSCANSEISFGDESDDAADVGGAAAAATLRDDDDGDVTDGVTAKPAASGRMVLVVANRTARILQ